MGKLKWLLILILSFLICFILIFSLSITISYKNKEIVRLNKQIISLKNANLSISNYVNYLFEVQKGVQNAENNETLIDFFNNFSPSSGGVSNTNASNRTSPEASKAENKKP